MKLIVGLGNPGQEYENTRHNIGYNMVDQFLGEVKWSKNEFGLYYKLGDTIFLKPSTYMNLSGNAVAHFINYYKIELKNLLIIQDDINVNIGEHKFKRKSSSGGHNGIKSIISSLGSDQFLRIKIGISKPKTISSSFHVLGKFSKKEKDLINEQVEIIYSMINDFIIGHDPDYLMNKYN